MTEEDLTDLINNYHVPKIIMRHMQKVAAVSLFIGTKLVKNGEKLDLTILRQAALLHDLVKLCDFKNIKLDDISDFNASDILFWSRLIKSCHKDGHILAVCKILNDLSEPLLAAIIKKHRFTSIIDENISERPTSWEEKLLYYADKRVTHDQLVTVKERIEYGRNKYFNGEISKENLKAEAAIEVLEKEICEKAGISPDQITEENIIQYLPSTY